MAPEGLRLRDHPRFDIRGPLGSGGFGDVYEAFDRQRDQRVALKVLKRQAGRALLQFKQEFRALADLSHPNLVTLYELFCEESGWFFTMECVDGVDLSTWLEGGAGRMGAGPSNRLPSPSTDTSHTLRPTLPDGSAGQPMTEDDNGSGRVVAGSRHWSNERAERIHIALSQLVEGVQALHTAHKLHRDLKPANIYVTSAGQLKVLDGGLVYSLMGAPEEREVSLAGTPAYMSPEQLRGEPLGSASDWFAVGCILYQALTGYVPFQGDLAARRAVAGLERPAPLSGLVAGVPPALETLCLALLDPVSESRADGQRIRALLDEMGAPSVSPSSATGQGLGGAPALTPSTLRSGDGPRWVAMAEPRTRGSETSLAEPSELVGRDAELAALHATWSQVGRSDLLLTIVRGASGLGKTALARQFAAQVQARQGDAGKSGAPVVLQGRCHPREVVPFRGLEGMVDALARSLQRTSLAQQVVPGLANTDALLRLFPVLESVPLLSDAAGRAAQTADAAELGREAALALRELMVRLTQVRPVLIVLDDMQWADEDGMRLFDTVFSPPFPPPLMLLVLERPQTDPAPGEPGRLRADWLEPRRGCEVCQLALAPLDEASALALARRALAPGLTSPGELTRWVVAESAGNPFWLQELATHSQGGAEAASQLTPHAALAQRLSRLSAPARRLVELVAAAGRPVREAACAAAAETGSARSSVVAELIAERLIVSRSSPRGPLLEPVHDQLAEALLAPLSPDDRAGLSRCLADALEAREDADPLEVVLHLRLAGETTRAHSWALRAAARATEAMAFVQAAELYRVALETAPQGSDRAVLHLMAAEAAASAGRPGDAAALYLAALPHVQADQRLTIQIQAAAQLLRGGGVCEGLRLLREISGQMRIPTPDRRWAWMARVVSERIQVAVTSWRADRRADRRTWQPARPEQIEEVDRAWRLASVLSAVDMLQAVPHVLRHVRLARAAGEPRQVALSLALQAMMANRAAAPAHAKANRLLERARSLAEQSGDPMALGFVALAKCLLLFSTGQLSASVAQAEIAQHTFRTRCAGATWELGMATHMRFFAMHFLGRIAELRREATEVFAAARDAGDQLTLSVFHLAHFYLSVIDDDPDLSLRRVAHSASLWPNERLYYHHLYEVHARACIGMYVDPATAPLHLIEDIWAQAERSGHLWDPMNNMTAYALRARCALVKLQLDPRERRLIPKVKKWTQVVHDMGPFGAATAGLLRGSLAFVTGDSQRAKTLFAQAEALSDQLELGFYVACAQMTRGKLLGGAEGDALAERGHRFLSDQGLVRPEQAARIFAPGVL